jgi:hypothetical protein
VGGVEVIATIEVMSASLVYLLLRQILQILTQLARDGGPRTSSCSCCVTR